MCVQNALLGREVTLQPAPNLPRGSPDLGRPVEMMICRTITAKKLRLSTTLLAERSNAADLKAALTNTVINTELLIRVLVETGVLDKIEVTAIMTIRSTIWMIPAIL